MVTYYDHFMRGQYDDITGEVGRREDDEVD